MAVENRKRQRQPQSTPKPRLPRERGGPPKRPCLSLGSRTFSPNRFSRSQVLPGNIYRPVIPCMQLERVWAWAEFLGVLLYRSGLHLCIPMQSMRNEDESYLGQ